MSRFTIPRYAARRAVGSVTLAVLSGILLALPVPELHAQQPVPAAAAKTPEETQFESAINKLLNNPAVTVTAAAVTKDKFAVRLDGTLGSQGEIDAVLALLKTLQPAPVVAINSQLRIRASGIGSANDLARVLRGLLNGDSATDAPIKVWVGQVDERRFAVRLTGELSSQDALDGAVRSASALVPSPVITLNTSGLMVAKDPKPPTVEKVDRWRMNFLPLGVKPLNPGDGRAASPQSKDTIDLLVDALNRIYGTPTKPAVERANYAELLLRGTPDTRLQIKKILAVIDVAWPQVQTNLWAIQVSGEQSDVGRRVSYIQAQIKETRLLVRDMLGMLNQVINENAFRFTSTTNPNDHSIHNDPNDPDTPHDLLIRMRTLGFQGDPQGRLSLNEMLIFVAIDPGRLKSSGLEPLTTLFVRKVQQHPRYGEIEKAWKQARVNLGGKDDVKTPFPTFLSTFSTFNPGLGNADLAGIKTFVITLETFQKTDKATTPDDQRAPLALSVAAAAADRLLKGAVDAFSADIEDMFFQPLLERCQAIGAGGNGVSLVGQTRIVVTSNIEARLAPSMSSYVETTRPRPFGKEILDAAFPQTRTSSDARNAATTSSASSTTTNGTTTTTGPTTTATSGETLSDTRATNGLTGSSLLLSTLTPLQAVGLATVLNSTVEPTFSRVAPGIAVNIRPMVFPDGGSARMVIDAQFGVRTTAIGDNSSRKDVFVYPQPTAVESHEVTTDTAVSAFDLFDLSHFSVMTSTPQPPEVFPLLGRLPIIGPMFQRPRGNKDVHFESIILVNTVILPRALEMARFYAGN